MNRMSMLLGKGMAQEASNDVTLRRKWLALKEQESLGEIGRLPDYATWRRMQSMPETPKHAVKLK